jgi:hypothetical protein
MRTWAGNDTLTDNNANAQPANINGGLGTDTCMYSGKATDYTITQQRDGTITVASKSSAAVKVADTLTNIEQVKFSDVAFNSTVRSVAASISTADLEHIEELYLAFFNRVPTQMD